MQFFLYEVLARIVAIYLCVDCSRELWNGFSDRKIAYFNDDIIDGFFIDWSKVIAQRDTMPIRYWIQMGLRIFMLPGCGFVAIFGWQPST